MTTDTSSTDRPRTTRRAGTRHSMVRRAAATAALAATLTGLAARVDAAELQTLSAIPNDGHIALAWVPDPSVDRYDVRRDGVTIGWTTGTSFAASAQNGTRHSFEVVARTGADGERLVGRLTAVALDLLPPDVSGNLHVTATSDTSAKVTYGITRPAPDAIAYHVVVDGRIVGSGTQTELSGTIHVSGLVAGIEHYVKLLAQDTLGNVRIVSGPFRLELADATVPPVPISLRASACHDGVSLSWGAFGGASGSGGFRWDISRDGAHLATVSSPAFTDRAATAGVPHSYRVTARSAANVVSMPTPELLVTRTLKGGCVIQVQRDEVELPQPTISALHGRRQVNATATEAGASLWVAPRAGTGDARRVAGLAVYVDDVLQRTAGGRSVGGAIETSYAATVGLAGTAPRVEVAYIDVDGTVGPRVAIPGSPVLRLSTPRPADVAVTNDASGLSVSWTHPEATTFEVAVDGTTITTTDGDHRATLTALGPNDASVVRVRAVGAEGQRSLWSDAITVAPRTTTG